MMNVDIGTIGIISSIPDISTLVSLPMAAFLADYLRGNGILSVPNVNNFGLNFSQNLHKFDQLIF